jgi:DNA invertase Pin-like site-specific DNA recombinase
MAGQGRMLSGDVIRRVIHLLASTEMTTSEIARRMSVSRSTILAINRKSQARPNHLTSLTCAKK